MKEKEAVDERIRKQLIRGKRDTLLKEKEAVYGLGCGGAPPRERILIGLIMSDRKLEASIEGSK